MPPDPTHLTILVFCSMLLGVCVGFPIENDFFDGGGY